MSNSKLVIFATAIAASSVLSINAVSATPDAGTNVVQSMSRDALQANPLFLQNPTLPNSTAQVTSVSQFSDVQPTEWAFTALQSLVERYGCISGYPNGTFRGSRALSRYEFAAGLNACLDKINELISSGLADKVGKEDLATLQKLQEVFSAELAALKGRVAALEAKTQTLEAQQFSATTKLVGEVTFNLAGASVINGNSSNVVFQSRGRLQLVTSFTGKDVLYTRLTFGNSGTGFTGILGTNEGRYAYDGQAANTVTLDRLHYVFSLTDNLRVTAMAGLAGHHFYADTFNTGLEAGGGATGALTRFAERNSIYRFGLATNSAGIGLNYRPTQAIEVALGYIAPSGSNPDTGLFGGNYSALAQVSFRPSNSFRFGFNYLRSFSPAVGDRFNFGGTGTNLANFTGTSGLPGSVTSSAISSDSYGFQALYDVSPELSIRGWVGYTKAQLLNVGNADILNYALAFTFPDLFNKGSLGAIIFGSEPYLTALQASGNPNFRRDTPFTLEAQYKYAISRNISITPGLIVLFNRNQNSDNGTALIGTLRTTYTF
jgi:hypothetical protein